MAGTGFDTLEANAASCASSWKCEEIGTASCASSTETRGNRRGELRVLEEPFSV
jgi:hypothetical protein